MSLILSPAPSNLVDLFLNLERLEIVKLWLVRLKLCIKLILARLFLAFVSFKEDYASTFVACCQVRAGMVELDGRDDVRFSNLFDLLWMEHKASI